jgi:hypothetical protein
MYIYTKYVHIYIYTYIHIAVTAGTACTWSNSCCHVAAAQQLQNAARAEDKTGAAGKHALQELQQHPVAACPPRTWAAKAPGPATEDEVGADKVVRGGSSRTPDSAYMYMYTYTYIYMYIYIYIEREREREMTK